MIAALRALDFVRRIFLLARADLQEPLELCVVSTLDELSVLFVVTPYVFDLSQKSLQLVWIKMVSA